MERTTIMFKFKKVLIFVVVLFVSAVSLSVAVKSVSASTDFDDFKECWLKDVADYPDCVTSDFDEDGLIGVQDFNDFKNAILKYDLNGDGVISLDDSTPTDFQPFYDCWLKISGDAEWEGSCEKADFDDDNVVGIQDFGNIKAAWQKYDLNGDGVVNTFETDYDIFQLCWLKDVADYPDCAASDFDGDDFVGPFDYTMFGEAIATYDLNDDGIVNYEPNASSDYDAFQECWGKNTTSDPDCTNRDFDEDGVIGFNDYNLFGDVFTTYDLNDDGVINSSSTDYDVFQLCWWKRSSDSEWAGNCEKADFDPDGFIGPNDLNFFNNAIATYDLDGDRQVALSDYDAFQLCWWKRSSDSEWAGNCEKADFDPDGFIGPNDLNFFNNAIATYDLNGDGVVNYGGLKPDLEMKDIFIENDLLKVEYCNDGVNPINVNELGIETFYIKVIANGKTHTGTSDNSNYIFSVPDAEACAYSDGYPISYFGLEDGESYTVTATLDHLEEVDEFSENNNTSTKTIAIESIENHNIVINNIEVINIYENSVTIKWSTNILGNSKVWYGTEDTMNGRNFMVGSDILKTNHEQELVNLQSNTIYYFRILSTDSENNITESISESFTTLQYDTECKDSDDGKDYFTKGISNTFSDYCVDGIMLREFWCSNSGEPKQNTYNCPNGCSNGACITTNEKPDLIVKNLIYNKESSDLTTIDFDIMNIGEGDATDWFAVAVYINDEIYTHTLYGEQKIGTSYANDDDAVIPIESGGIYHWSLGSYSWLSGGNSITIVADKFDNGDAQENPLYGDLKDNMIGETNENNNTLSITIETDNESDKTDENSGNSGNSYIKRLVLKLKRVITKLERQVINLEKKLTKLNQKFANKHSGTMFLDVENHGRLWYVDPESKNRFYFENGESALSIGAKLATGITYEDLQKIPVGIADKLYNLKDTDGDGLPDRLESALGSDPNNTDTDGDGYSDKEELQNGYSPTSNQKYSYLQSLIDRLEGKMMLQVSGPHSHGEIWYIHEGKRWYGGTEDSMYEIMKARSLGAISDDIRKIEVGEVEGVE